MEFAMRDVLIERAQARGLQKIIGEYRESAKNQRVENLYADLGFRRLDKGDDGATWVYDLEGEHATLNQNIKVVPYGI
jgi:predicted enzyme involved in methoxymalonyl-ACP biosynthesis